MKTYEELLKIFTGSIVIMSVLTTFVVLIFSVQRACKYIGFIEEENRLIPLLNKLTSKIYLGKEYTGKENGTKQITPNMLDKVS